MDTIIDRILRHVHGEWAVMIGAPLLFLTAVSIAALILWFLIRGHFSERISAHEATIGHKQSLLDEYKDRLQGATPLEVQKKIASLEDQVAALDRRVNRPLRRLSPEASTEICRQIKEEIANNPEFGSPYWVTLNHSPDTDSSRYATQISTCLTEAGINVGRQLGAGRHDEGEYGITFYCPDFDADWRLMKLSKMFENAGLPITRRPDPHNPGSTYIFVTPEED